MQDERVTYPGARRPDRQRRVDAHGLSLAVVEWGPEDGPPILFVHGGFDFAGTFDGFAPRIADAGWRVVSWDQRGHGDSELAALYQWDADLRDALAVLDSVTSEACPILGHSKGGSLMVQFAEAMPHRVSHLINLDGLPSRRNMPDVQDHDRTKLLAGELSSWLDRHRSMGDAVRKPGTLDELAQRRARMNPRLPIEWLRYLVTVGARKDPDGWRWKIDPVMRPGGFGPWRPEWAMERLPNVGAPLLAVLGLELENMGWGTQPKDVEPYLPAGARFVPLEGVGHFVHIEQPDLIAGLVLEHIGRAPRPGAAGAKSERPPG